MELHWFVASWRAVEKVSSESVIFFASPSMREPADAAAPPALAEGMAVATVAKGTEPLIWSTCPLALSALSLAQTRLSRSITKVSAFHS